MQLFNNGRFEKSAEKSQYDLEASLLDAEQCKMIFHFKLHNNIYKFTE